MIDTHELKEWAVIAAIFSAILAPIAAWITHLVWVIGTLSSADGATAGQMVLAGIGAFMPPVGAVHGVMVWFGGGF